METMIFDTALGEFGIGWTETGVARVQLPGLDRASLLERINRAGGQPGEPTRAIAELIDQIEDYADGEVVDFSAVKLDSSARMVVVPTEQMRRPSIFALFTILQAASSMR